MSSIYLRIKEILSMREYPCSFLLHHQTRCPTMHSKECMRRNPLRAPLLPAQAPGSWLTDCLMRSIISSRSRLLTCTVILHLVCNTPRTVQEHAIVRTWPETARCRSIFIDEISLMTSDRFSGVFVACTPLIPAGPGSGESIRPSNADALASNVLCALRGIVSAALLSLHIQTSQQYAS
jgi:hypothetical protein